AQCPGGGIGRRTSFRYWRREAWRFESSPGHQQVIGRREFNDLRALRALRLPDCVTRVSNDAIPDGSSDEAHWVAYSRGLSGKQHAIPQWAARPSAGRVTLSLF